MKMYFKKFGYNLYDISYVCDFWSVLECVYNILYICKTDLGKYI